MQHGLAAGIAAVAVERGAGEPPAGVALQQVGRVLRLGILARRRRFDVGGMRAPVVVVAEDLRLDPGALERTPDRHDQLRLLGDRQVHARIAARPPVLWLVLDGHRVDGHAEAAVLAHEADEVARVRLVDPRVVDQPAADQRAVRLHPGRRAPRRADHLQLRIEPQRLAQQRQDLAPVVVDREAAHAVVRPAGREVVVGVVLAGHEVRRAHRLAQDGEAVAVAAEQALHGRVAPPAVEPVEDVGGRVRDRRAEPVHPLIGAARVDADRELVGAAGRERDAPAVGEAHRAVRGRDADLRRRGGRGGRRRDEQRQDGDDDAAGPHSSESSSSSSSLRLCRPTTLGRIPPPAATLMTAWSEIRVIIPTKRPPMQ